MPQRGSFLNEGLLNYRVPFYSKGAATNIGDLRKGTLI